MSRYSAILFLSLKDMYMRISNVVVILTLMMFASPVLATQKKHDAVKIPMASSLFVASTGEVVLTFLSKSAAYSDDLFLEGSPTRILNNQTAISGQTFSLGSFQAGTELVFRLFVNNTGYSFYNGEAENNPDNKFHAGYKQLRGGSIAVGFEDIFNGGDRDYNDMIFSVSNVTTISPVPEPEAYALMLIGLLMLVGVSRRKTN